MLAHEILASARQAWPPFVLVVGLLLIGAVAADEGVFEGLGARLARTRLGARCLLLTLLTLVALVSAVLNLDTAVVFLAPVLIHTARERGLDERPFLYGSVFMANAGSLLLPGSNLTNLLVLGSDQQLGVSFAARMFPAWLASCAVTASFVALAFPLLDAAPHPKPIRSAPLRLGIGSGAALAAAGLVVALPNPALPVLVVGFTAATVRRLRPRLDLTPLLLLLFALAVGLGAVARLWHGPAQLLHDRGAWTAAGIGAAASVLVNNLPAAALFSAQPQPHAYALLLGLNLGPNLAVTGSLSAVLWLQAARATNANASVAMYTRLGLVLVPLTLSTAVAALVATRL